MEYCVWCGIELRPEDAVPVLYDSPDHLPAFRGEDFECVDRVSCLLRSQQFEDPPPGPERLVITATDVEGRPVL